MVAMLQHCPGSSPGCLSPTRLTYAYLDFLERPRPRPRPRPLLPPLRLPPPLPLPLPPPLPLDLPPRVGGAPDAKSVLCTTSAEPATASGWCAGVVAPLGMGVSSSLFAPEVSASGEGGMTGESVGTPGTGDAGRLAGDAVPLVAARRTPGDVVAARLAWVIGNMWLEERLVSSVTRYRHVTWGLRGQGT